MDDDGKTPIPNLFVRHFLNPGDSHPNANLVTEGEYTDDNGDIVFPIQIMGAQAGLSEYGLGLYMYKSYIDSGGRMAQTDVFINSCVITVQVYNTLEPQS